MLLQGGGCGVGVFSAILVLLQQMMCVKGYSAPYSGGCGAALVGSGLVVSLIIGAIIDNVEVLKGRLEEIIKVRYCGEKKISFEFLENMMKNCHFHICNCFFLESERTTSAENLYDAV